MNYSGLIFAVFGCLSCILAEVTVPNQNQVVSDRSPNLRIRGSGFDNTNAGDISLALSAGDALPLVVNKDVIAEVVADVEQRPARVLATQEVHDTSDTPSIHREQVAELLEDLPAKVVMSPMGVCVYQSALQQTVNIIGSGFRAGMTITLEPELVAGTDYALQVANERNAMMHLIAGRKWPISTTGALVAKSVKIGDTIFKVGREEDDYGVHITCVRPDPVVFPSTTSYHETQSKLIVIEGTGFTINSETSITLRPTLSTAFKVLNVKNERILLQLHQDKSWLPEAHSLKGSTADTKIPLQVSIIDSGAGPVILNPPVTVGFIVPDLPGKRCDDTCEFAFDGVCDAGINNDHKRRRLKETDPNDNDHERDKNVDDYYAENTEQPVTACVLGTDCTDCGGVDAV